MKRIDLTGQRFTRLTAIAYAWTRKGQSCWRCVCDCGRNTVADTQNLKNGRTKSCGCLQLESRKVHGQCGSRTYDSWRAMHGRCRYPSNVRFYLYGQRGVNVCPGWNKFEQFLYDMGERPAGRTLDRIDPNGNYGPGNCRWATPKEQQANRRCVSSSPVAESRALQCADIRNGQRSSGVLRGASPSLAGCRPRSTS